jgi:hypothetical protein
MHLCDRIHSKWSNKCLMLALGAEYWGLLPEMTTNRPSAAPSSRSAAAERMRAHRQRRRDGLRCFTLEVRQTEIYALIRKGTLKADARNDPYAIRDALYEHLDRTLDEMP